MTAITNHSSASCAPSAASRGRLITFEGIDGAGKSSHIERSAAHLRQAGRTVITTREPGGTELGEQLRAMLLQQRMHLETEALLMFAARREHLAEVIEPALAQGSWVICDRFTDASFAYQGGGRGLARDKLETLERWVQGALQPDLTLVFDLPFAVARERIALQSRELDRFEQERADFHERVRQAYLERARLAAGRIRVIDATQTLENISSQVQQLIDVLLAK